MIKIILQVDIDDSMNEMVETYLNWIVAIVSFILISWTNCHLYL